ncbi:MAG: repair protein RecO [Patescibacteria group bacterium]|nr:repair protein RecO [Patescibacteria group bacterium]
MEYKYNGIILGKRNLGETDRMYVIYTREAGKIWAAGKGTRKPAAKLAGSLESLTESEIFISKNRGRGNITGAIAVDTFPFLKSKISFLESAFGAIGILEKLITDQEKDERIYALLKGYLAAMNKAAEEEGEDKKDILTAGLIFKLLDFSGYRTSFEACVKCRNKILSGRNYFSARLGGAVCPECFSGLGETRVSDGCVKMIRIILANKIESLGKLKVPPADIKNAQIVISEQVKWITG